MYTPVKPSLIIKKVGFKGVNIIKACFRDGKQKNMGCGTLAKECIKYMREISGSLYPILTRLIANKSDLLGQAPPEIHTVLLTTN